MTDQQYIELICGIDPDRLLAEILPGELWRLRWDAERQRLVVDQDATPPKRRARRVPR